MASKVLGIVCDSPVESLVILPPSPLLAKAGMRTSQRNERPDYCGDQDYQFDFDKQPCYVSTEPIYIGRPQRHEKHQEHTSTEKRHCSSYPSRKCTRLLLLYHYDKLSQSTRTYRAFSHRQIAVAALFAFLKAWLECQQ